MGLFDSVCTGISKVTSLVIMLIFFAGGFFIGVQATEIPIYGELLKTFVISDRKAFQQEPTDKQLEFLINFILEHLL